MSCWMHLTVPSAATPHFPPQFTPSGAHGTASLSMPHSTLLNFFGLPTDGLEEMLLYFGKRRFLLHVLVITRVSL